MKYVTRAGWTFVSHEVAGQILPIERNKAYSVLLFALCKSILKSLHVCRCYDVRMGSQLQEEWNQQREQRYGSESMNILVVYPPLHRMGLSVSSPPCR